MNAEHHQFPLSRMASLLSYPKNVSNSFQVTTEDFVAPLREQSQPVDGLQIVSRCRRVHRQQAERFVLGSRTSVLTQSVALHTFYTTNIGRRLEHIAELKYGTRMD